MYSRIPVPTVEWKEENRRYALCFFPLVGAVIGAVFYGWNLLCFYLGIGNLLRAAVSSVIPVLITGGIHLDGFCDVSDAKASCADTKRKLEIMSDPHIGSFAAIKLAVYLLVQTAVYSELSLVGMTAVSVMFAVSRALSGLAAVIFKNAKCGGTLQSFSEPAAKTATIIVISLTIVLCAAAAVFISPYCAVGAAAACALSFLYYRVDSYKNFGGITGDLAGWFLQICELSAACGILAAEIVSGVLL